MARAQRDEMEGERGRMNITPEMMQQFSKMGGVRRYETG